MSSIGSKLYRIHTCNDSIQWARQYLSEAPDGAVFLADILTHAHGRQGRTWTTYPGQLLVTFVLKPSNLVFFSQEDLPIKLNQIIMAMSLGILEPIKQYGAGLKWPNDFVIHNKKIGGILGTIVWEANQPLGIIVGFALNVNNIFEENDPLSSIATSLKAITGNDHNLRNLYAAIILNMNVWYEAWKQEKFMNIYKSWKNQQTVIGTSIKVHQKDGTILNGTAQQVLPNGDLILIDEFGKQDSISFYSVEEIKT